MNDESTPHNEPEENEPEQNEPKVVSINRELSAVALAVRGTQILAEIDAYDGFQDDLMELNSPSCVASMLALVGTRLELVGRVVRREVNPAVLWAPHNAVGEHEFRDDRDVLLTEWNHT